MRVRDVMTSDVMAVRQDSTARAAFEAMVSAAVRHLPVLDETGRVVGMISDRDVRSNAVMLGRRLSADNVVLPDGLTASELMSPRPVTVGPDASAREAVALMLARRIGALPVVEDDVLLGIVTETDMLRLLMTLL